MLEANQKVTVMLNDAAYMWEKPRPTNACVCLGLLSKLHTCYLSKATLDGSSGIWWPFASFILLIFLGLLFIILLIPRELGSKSENDGFRF